MFGLTSHRTVKLFVRTAPGTIGAPSIMADSFGAVRLDRQRWEGCEPSVQCPLFAVIFRHFRCRSRAVVTVAPDPLLLLILRKPHRTKWKSHEWWAITIGGVGASSCKICIDGLRSSFSSSLWSSPCNLMRRGI